MLEGELSEFALPEVLQLLAYTSKSGRLTLHGDAVVGRVDVVEGELVDASSDAGRLALARRLIGTGLVEGEKLASVLAARLSPPSDLELAAALTEVDADRLADLLRDQTVDAVFDLLRWQEGSFRFDAGDLSDLPAAARAAARPVEEVLEEARARLEEWPSVEQRTGASDEVVAIRRPEEHRGAEIAPDGWGMLALVDGRRTVGELATLSGQGEFRTRHTLAGLVDAGVVAIGRSEAAGVEELVRGHELLAELEAGLPGPTDDVQVPTEPPPPPPADVVEVGEPRVLELDGHSAGTLEQEAEGEHCGASEGQDGAAAAPAAGSDDDARSPAAEGGEVTPLHTRLRTDPSVDAELIERLIDGVENLS